MVDFLGFKTLRGGGPEMMASLLEIFTTSVRFFNSKSFASVSHFDFKSLENFRGFFTLAAIFALGELVKSCNLLCSGILNIWTQTEF